MKTITTILFDLGGVLVELGGMSTMHSWMGNTCNDEKLMELWLASTNVREFESGNTSTESFVRNIVDELDLPVSPEQFLEQFTTWPSGIFPGVKQLLTELRKHYTLVSLSNTNQVHWPIVMNDLELETYFDHHFPSHYTGLLKPDQTAFENVLETLHLDAASVLFFDDSATNVAAVKTLGIEATRTVGFKELEAAIRSRDLLASDS